MTSTNIGTGTGALRSIALDSNNRYVVGGYYTRAGVTNMAVVRYHTNGKLDTQFGTTGAATLAITTGTEQANAVAIQPNGKILAGGSFTEGTPTWPVVARLQTNGLLDTTFFAGGFLTFHYEDFAKAQSVTDIYVASDGRIFLTGQSAEDASTFGSAVMVLLP